MGGGDQILERAARARSCASVPVGLSVGSRDGVTGGAEGGMEHFGGSYDWAAWRDLSGPVASYILSTWRGPRLCKAGHPGHAQVLL